MVNGLPPLPDDIDFGGGEAGQAVLPARQGQIVQVCPPQGRRGRAVVTSPPQTASCVYSSMETNRRGDIERPRRMTARPSA
jgi:hypothetical protein